MSWNGKTSKSTARLTSQERAATTRPHNAQFEQMSAARQEAQRKDDRPPHLVTVISEHRKRGKDVAQGCKRVMAIVRYGTSSKRTFTRHVDINHANEVKGWK